MTVVVRRHGGIAQLARAIGSYPIGRGFKSNFRYQRPVGQEVKTPPFHGSNGGSIPPRVTKEKSRFGGFFSLVTRGKRGEKCQFREIGIEFRLDYYTIEI